MLPRANVRKIGIDPKGEVRVDSAGFRAAEFGFQLVPGAGLEPARAGAQGILSPQCLPIPSSRHTEVI